MFLTKRNIARIERVASLFLEDASVLFVTRRPDARDAHDGVARWSPYMQDKAR